MQASYTYDPSGNPSSTGATSSNTQQYTGRENDGTGLQYNRARYYSPTLQRFISEDPLGFGGGDVNLYAYVGNDPINLSDPSGLCPLCAVMAMDVIGAVAAGAGAVGVATGAAIGAETDAAIVGSTEADTTAASDAAGTCSFSGNTSVSTASGATAINQIQPGDQVQAYDPATASDRKDASSDTASVLPRCNRSLKERRLLVLWPRSVVVL